MCELQMSDNRSFLIDSLVSGPPLDGRYEEIECVNYDPTLRTKLQGFFSLVFKARDKLTDRTVAIKFFDPDPSKIGDPYRISAFQREPVLLQQLLGKNRCLQLVSGLNNHVVRIVGPPTFEMRFPYFVIEWIEGHIEQYFQSQDSYDAEAKLRLFRDVLLSVEALHRNEIHHRDLKPDNFRSYFDNIKRIVVAIDLGTAARLGTVPISGDYSGPVGFLWYSAPEAYCGLAGHRQIARYTDHFALGCMLFELFSPDYFGEQLRRSGQFDRVCAALCHLLLNVKDPKDRVQQYDFHMEKLKYAVMLPTFRSRGVVAPASIGDLLDRALRGLTTMHFRDRVQSLGETRQLIDVALRVLTNERESKRRIELKRRIKQNRIERIEAREKRLQERLESNIFVRRLPND